MPIVSSFKTKPHHRPLQIGSGCWEWAIGKNKRKFSGFPNYLGSILNEIFRSTIEPGNFLRRFSTAFLVYIIFLSPK
ncbi:MAG: hypothetical protein BGN92_07415 [Sphingobacteriales bacterium 41-5]|nr:MAG: hypothetical protein BGN92_07415 [Sphingobacteriales bacterium 41-5]